MSETGLPHPPSAAQLDRLTSLLEPLARVVQPKVYGTERIPDRGVLFVGNHTLYGLIDVPFLIAELWRREIEVRPLGDHAHYAIPVWRNLLELCGMVRGTRENVRALMREGQNVLVFPGGAGEVFRRRDERYRLKWKERLGFARLAVEFGYPIVPFAEVGVEEMFDVVADDRTRVVRDASRLLERLAGVPIPPVGVGVAPLLPRPERMYFWFGEAIETAAPRDLADVERAVRAVREEARAAVEGGIDFLRAERDADPRRGLAARLRAGSDEPPLARSDPDAWFVVRGLDAWNRGGAQSAAAWLSRWAVLQDARDDAPGPGSANGRDAVLARLQEIADGLGARWLHIRDAHSYGEEVLVAADLRTGRAHGGATVATMQLLFEVQCGEVVKVTLLDTGERAFQRIEHPAARRRSERLGT